MKEIWLLADGDDWDKIKDMVRDAIELGYDGIAAKREFLDNIKKLGRINVIPIEDCLVEVKSAEDQQKIANMKFSLVKFKDWKIIPLENIIAMKGKDSKIIAVVNDFDEAKVVLETLEKGADGIAVSGTREDLKKYYDIVKVREERIELRRARIIEIKPLGLGERVCIDTVTIMDVGEGMLIGNKAGFMFLVASESEECEYVSSRPFRVNAGSVNAYIKIGDKTKYLIELEAGDEIDIVRYDGRVRRSFVGRVKIERRPLILIRAEVDGEEGTVILQNAETIKLIDPEGRHISVSQLKEGDEVLVWIGEKGRHFGIKINEFIIEK